jgi:hypothetical protein
VNETFIEDDAATGRESGSTAEVMDTDFLVAQIVDLENPYLLDLLSMTDAFPSQSKGTQQSAMRVLEDVSDEEFDREREFAEW